MRCCGHPLVDEVAHPLGKEFEPLTDPFPVARCHRSCRLFLCRHDANLPPHLVTYAALDTALDHSSRSAAVKSSATCSTTTLCCRALAAASVTSGQAWTSWLNGRAQELQPCRSQISYKR